MTGTIETFQTKNGSIVVEGTEIRINENATIEDWKLFGKSIKKTESGIQWILGAWWNYGHKKWSSDAEEIIKELGYSRNTLKKNGYIYNAVTSLRRRNSLSFRHHEDVAALSPEKQDHYLDKAEKEKLSSTKLRAVIREVERPETEKKESKKKTKKTKTKKEKAYGLTEKRVEQIKVMVGHIVELMSVSMLTLIPQSCVIGELKKVQEELNKFKF